jgi:hypothetical protein
MKEVIKALDPYLQGLDKEVVGRINEAVAAIQELQKEKDIWGHGVARQQEAEQIMNDGLYTAWSAPQDLMHQLSEHRSALIRQLRGWDYEARKYIVLVALAKGITATDVGGIEMREKSKEDASLHVFEPAQPPKGVNPNADKRIPTERIVGYWDAQNYQLHLRS